MSIFAHLMVLAQSTDDGLTLAETVQALPTDPASLVTLGLVLASCGAVIWFGRPRGGGDGTAA